jgi:hypothetical protein
MTSAAHKVIAEIEERCRSRATERMSLNKQLAQLNQDQADDEATLKNLRKIYGVPGEAAEKKQDREPLGAAPPKMLIKDMVLSIVRHDGGIFGVTSSQIRAKAALKYRVDLNQHTLSVTLRRHKKAGRVVLQNGKWISTNPLLPLKPLSANGHADAEEISP